MQSPRRLGARRARSAGHTPAATLAAAPRAPGPSRAPSEATADTGNGELTSCLHCTEAPLHWSPPNCDLIGHPTYSPSLITPTGNPPSTFYGQPVTLSLPMESPPPLLMIPRRIPNLSFDFPFPLGWTHGSLLRPTQPMSLMARSPLHRTLPRTPSSRAKERPPRARPASTSPSPGAHGRRGGPEGNSSSRSPGPHPGSWSSSRSPSKSRSRSPDKRTRSPSLSPSPKKPLGR